MNHKIIIKDRAVIRYETPEFENEQKEMSFEEFKTKFFKEKINISKIKITNFQKFDKELLAIASLIEDFKFIATAENNLVILRNRKGFYIGYKGNEISMSYNNNDMFMKHGTEYNRSVTQSSKEAFVKISRLLPLIRLESHNFVPSISFEKNWTVVEKREGKNLWEQYISNKAVLNVLNKETVEEILIRDNTEIEKFPKFKKIKSSENLIIRNEDASFAIERFSETGETHFCIEYDTYELINGADHFEDRNIPENDAKKFIDIIEKARHFVDDSFEDLLAPLKNPEDRLKEKMAPLEEVEM